VSAAERQLFRFALRAFERLARGDALGLARGQIAFGLLIGALTGVIRVYGGYPEGICYAILIGNALAPAFNLWFRPKRVFSLGAPS